MKKQNFGSSWIQNVVYLHSNAQSTDLLMNNFSLFQVCRSPTRDPLMEVNRNSYYDAVQSAAVIKTPCYCGDPL